MDRHRFFAAGRMRTWVIVSATVCVAVVLLGAAWSFFDTFLAPLFFNARVERLHESGLPNIEVKNGRTVHCRMKADDFEFPLPPGAQAVHPMLTSGGFDTVDGSVEAQFGTGAWMSPDEYERWLNGKVQVGGWITAETISGGLLIKFHYFGDK